MGTRDRVREGWVRGTGLERGMPREGRVRGTGLERDGIHQV